MAISSCAPVRTCISVDCDPGLRPRLDDLLKRAPLPEGCAIEPGAACLLRLTIARDKDKAGLDEAADRASEDAGPLWLGVALPVDDPRFDISSGDAGSLGIEPLEDIIPPMKSPKIEGRWPGEQGYPFVSHLEISLESSRGAIPRALRSWLKAAAEASAGEESRPVVLAATGDLETGEYGSSQLLAGENGFTRLLGAQLLSAMRRSDILVGNLEGQITARGSPDPTKHYRFRFPPGCAGAYRSLGFGLLLLGNNHSMDFGTQGLLDTIDDLDKAGLPYVGAGSTEDEAERAKEASGSYSKGIAFVGLGAFPKEELGFSTARAAATEASPGIVADVDRCIASIREATREGAMAVALVHGGVEFSGGPDEETRAIFRRLADAGAALVIGSHPHVLHGIEARGSSIIAYSLGNFLFTDRTMPPAARPSALMSFLVYGKKVRGFDILPVIASPTGTSIDPDPAAAKRHFAALCSELAARK